MKGPDMHQMMKETLKPSAARRAFDSGFGFRGFEPFPVTVRPIAFKYTVKLHGLIEDSAQFFEALDAFEHAGENDIVEILLQTPGGSLDAADTFIHAMRQCPAKVVVNATGGIHSAGTLILLEADEFLLSHNANMLFHNGSVGVGGKTSDWLAQSRFTAGYMERVMRESYADFLTNDEIDALIAGRDFWFDADTFVERWNKREEIRAERYEAAMQQALEDAMAEDDDEEVAVGLTD